MTSGRDGAKKGTSSNRREKEGGWNREAKEQKQGVAVLDRRGNGMGSCGSYSKRMDDSASEKRLRRGMVCKVRKQKRYVRKSREPTVDKRGEGWFPARPNDE